MGTRARKVRSKSFAAFDSIGYPIAAFIDDNRIIKYLEAPAVSSEVRFAPSISDSVFLLKLIPRELDPKFSLTLVNTMTSL